MKTVFDPSFPPEQQTAQFWEDVFLDAIAEWLLKQMDDGRIAPPISYEESTHFERSNP